MNIKMILTAMDKSVIFLGLLLLLCLPLFTYPTLFFTYISSKVLLFRAIVPLLFISCLTHRLVSKTSFGWSWPALASCLFVLLAFISSMFGVDYSHSLFGTLERMDGVVQEVHMLLFFFAISYLLSTNKAWNYWIGASVLVALAIVLQALGTEGIHQRLSGLIGNSSYLGAYLLLPIYWLAYLFSQTRLTWLRFVYIGIMGLLCYALILTGSRGALLGLFAGASVGFGYWVLFEVKTYQYKKIPLLLMMVVLLIIALALSYCVAHYFATGGERIFSLQAYLSEIRPSLWAIAIKAWLKTPILGVGMNNFSHAFSSFYTPNLYEGYQWYDKVHNSFLEWLLAGGLLGFFAYFGLYFSAAYSVLSKKSQPLFSTFERLLLLGMIVAYAVQSFFLFDTIAGYMSFFSLLAFIHCRTRVATVYQLIGRQSGPMPNSRHLNLAACCIPLLLVGFYLYLQQSIIPIINASQDMQRSKLEQSANLRYHFAHDALRYGSSGQSEILSTVAETLLPILQFGLVPPKEQRLYATQTLSELSDYLKRHPNDEKIRYNLALTALVSGDFSLATHEANTLLNHSPQRQLFLILLGQISSVSGNQESALAYYQKAYDLDKRNEHALGLLRQFSGT